MRLLGSFWTPLALSAIAFSVGIGAGLTSKTGASKTQTQLDLEKIAKTDPRIEYLSRAICKVRGIDPDYQGFPYPRGPVWEIYILQSRDLLAAIDAAAEWSRLHPELQPSQSKPIVPKGTSRQN